MKYIYASGGMENHVIQKEQKGLEKHTHILYLTGNFLVYTKGNLFNEKKKKKKALGINE